jgi:hypothetical protein
VLGTFITEWDEGRLICNKFLATKESAQMYAERLAELAIDLGFDGWLVYSLLKFRMLNLNLSWARLNNSHHVISITFLMCLKVHAKCSLSPLCKASFDNYYQICFFLSIFDTVLHDTKRHVKYLEHQRMLFLRKSGKEFRCDFHSISMCFLYLYLFHLPFQLRWQLLIAD